MQTPRSNTRRPRLKKWLRRSLLLGALFLLLAWFAPAMAARTTLRHRIAQYIFSSLRAEITVGSASLGWLSPVVLRDVEVRDPQGNLLLEVPEAESSYHLLRLLRDTADAGTWSLRRPTLRVGCAEQGSDVEDAIYEYLYPESGSSGYVAVTVAVDQGVIEVYDESTQHRWTLSPVALTVEVPPPAAGPLRVRVDSQLEPSGGRLAGEFTYAGWDAPAGSGKQDIRVALDTAEFPLPLLLPLARRADPAAHLEGRLFGKLTARWREGEGGSGRTTADSDLKANDLAVAGSWLAGEQLRLASLEMPCKLDAGAGRVTVEQAAVRCDVGTAECQGAVSTDGLPGSLFAEPGCKLRADVDLAKLAALLPKTLRLREDTEVRRGSVRLAVESARSGGDVVWRGDLKTADLMGTAQGQPFVWADPLTAEFAVRHTGKGLPTVDLLRCDSSFLRAEASGSMDDWRLGVTYDLDRLAAQLSQFVDAGAARLAGRGSTDLVVRLGDDKTFTVTGNSNFKDLQISGLSAQPLREPSLAVKLTAGGELPGHGYPVLRNGRAEVTAGGEVLLVQLGSAFNLGGGNDAGKGVVTFRGDMAEWQRHLQPFVAGVAKLKLKGYGEGTAKIGWQGFAMTFEDAKATFKDLQYSGYGLAVAEPQVTLTGRGAYDIGAGTLTLTDAAVDSATVRLDLPKATVKSAAGGYAVDAAGKVKGDLARLRQWLQPPGSPPGLPVAGDVAGTVAVKTTDGKTSMLVDLEGRQLVLGPKTSPLWQEPTAVVRGTAMFDPAADTLEFRQLQLAGGAFGVSSGGRIDKLSAARDVTLDGELSYDLARLEPVLRRYLGGPVQLTGKGQKPFRLSGQLGAKDAAAVMQSLRGDAALGWTSFAALGLEAGPADVEAQVKDGWLNFRPIRATLNKGKLDLEPVVRLDPQQPTLYLRKGKVVDRAEITPDMCAGAVQYALPALSGMTEGEGQISLDLQGATVPLGDPAKLDMQGQITIHQARIGATPLLRELAVLLQAPGEARLVKESQVPFRVVNGRVYHSRMELTFPDLTIRTSGSVGIADGSLDLIAEFPVPRKWVPANKYTRAMAEQTVRLPVRGTLSRPRLDQNALAEANREALRGIATNLIEQGINEGLKRLLDRNK